jgi:hypothetical protein
MKLSDQLIHSMTWRLSRHCAGIAVLRFIRWTMPRLWPYEPPENASSGLALATRFAVEARTSTIEGAGTGLFAAEKIPSGEVLGEYDGDRITSLAKWLRLRNKDYVMLTDTRGVVIDALGHPEMKLRYVNHHFDTHRQNLMRKADGENVYFVTTCEIAPGEELFTDYGDLYWKLRDVNPLRTRS